MDRRRGRVTGERGAVTPITKEISHRWSVTASWLAWSSASRMPHIGATDQCCHHCARQLDRQDGLGHDGHDTQSVRGKALGEAVSEERTPKGAWGITALLFSFMLINFADKTVVGLAAVPIMRDLDLTPRQFGFLG